MALLVSDRFIFPYSNVSDKEYNNILSKAILSKNDILKFASYYYEDEDLDYDEYDAIFKRIIKQNDCELWEILNQNMRIEDDVPDYSSCLRYALKYADYQFLGHILYYFCTTEKQDDILYDDLKDLSARNPDYRVRRFVNQLDYLLPQRTILSSKMAVKKRDIIFGLYRNIN
jgi:hypothetical protein